MFQAPSFQDGDNPKSKIQNPKSNDALSFYLDNQEEINTYIERNRIPEELIHPAVKAAMRKL